MLDAQSVSISIGTAIAAIPNRVNALRRDILSVIVVSLSFGPAAFAFCRTPLEGGVAMTVLQKDIAVKAAAPPVSIELREDRTGPLV